MKGSCVLESKIQTKITLYLKSINHMVNKISVCSLNGWPDLVSIDLDGNHYYWEVKNETGRMSMVQQIIHKRLKNRCCIVHTVRSVDEVKEILCKLVQ